MNNKKKTYIISIAIPLIIGIAASLLTSGQMHIYKEIVKPPLAPPAFIFPIVWTILYILMGISSARIILTPSVHGEQKKAILLYILQLFLNFIWPIVFFNFKSYKISFVIIILLWYTVFRMIMAFFEVDKKAALYQIPYLLWITFATYLNLAIALLN